MTKRVVVLGLGNPLMADEGIGVCLVERLVESAGDFPDVDFIDAGTGGLAVLHHIEGRRKAIFLDCAYLGQEPGSIRRFVPDEVCSTKVLAHQSLHEADLLRIIDMARQLGQAPDEIVIFGIQPQRVEPGLGLSPSLMSKIESYLALILRELNV
ncbi:MAG: HyaD/HybD family hydrogenase maturation endopeptidase [Phycisphaerales bacterium]